MKSIFKPKKLSLLIHFYKAFLASEFKRILLTHMVVMLSTIQWLRPYGPLRLVKAVPFRPPAHCPYTKDTRGVRVRRGRESWHRRIPRNRLDWPNATKRCQHYLLPWQSLCSIEVNQMQTAAVCCTSGVIALFCSRSQARFSHLFLMSQFS